MIPTTATAYYTMILGDRTELDVATDARAAGASIRDYLIDAHDAAVSVGMVATDECYAWLDAIETRVMAAWDGSSVVEVEIEVAGATYGVRVDRGAATTLRPVVRVSISRNGVYAGSGWWDDAIVDCPADLGDDAFDAIDIAIRAALA